VAEDTLSCKNNKVGEPQQLLVWQHLLDRFQGDFDNYHQVVEDRKQNLLPREGGGHENFHCTLIPVSETGRLAAFYFDGNPQRIFRFRYYELLPSSSDDNSGSATSTTRTTNVEMKLYTLHPELEGLLRSHSEEPLQWPSLFSEFEEVADAKKIDYLPNCEVTWSLELDPEKHAYALEKDETDGIHAVMVHGEAIVESTLLPGVQIRILDQLSLYKDVFYINDRGLDPKSGAFIYGNQRGVPYRLERVSKLFDGARHVVNDDLQWTLGPQFRTDSEYQSKLDAIGGPSAGMKRPPPPTTKS
jgi:hypothetical protein